MEDVLDVYMRPYDPLRPQVCLDETSIQLVREKRIPLPMAPGRPARFDNEYERNGVCACSCSTNRFVAGAKWLSPTNALVSISHTSSNTWSTSTTQMPSRSCW